MGLVGGLVASAAASGGPVFSDPLMKDRHTVDAKAPKRIGDDYACAVVTAREPDPSRQLLIYVASDAAVRRAESVRESSTIPIAPRCAWWASACARA